MRSIAHLWPILLMTACVDRTLGDSATGDASTGATETTTATTPSSASDTTPNTTTPPTTGPATTGPGTSTSTSTTTGPGTTTGPVTTGPSSTVTTDVSTTSDPPDTTGDIKLDLPRFMEPPPGLVGCTLDAPPNTGIKGQTTLGPFFGDRAYFGAVVINGILGEPNLMVLAPGADPATEFKDQQGFTGAILTGMVFTDPYDNWAGSWELSGGVHDKGKFAAPAVTVTITQLAGNWDAPDPGDPPRLIGTIDGDFVGTFDAVYCDQLDVQVIAE